MAGVGMPMVLPARDGDATRPRRGCYCDGWRIWQSWTLVLRPTVVDDGDSVRFFTGGLKAAVELRGSRGTSRCRGVTVPVFPAQIFRTVRCMCDVLF